MNTTLHYSLHQLFCKNTTFTLFVSFLKKTLNFTHSCAFAQIAQFYALQMLKKQISRILDLPSWQHWTDCSNSQCNVDVGGAMHFIYYINRLTATKVDSTYLLNQQYTAYMTVAGLERMTTGSAVSALSYRATQVGVYIFIQTHS